MSYENSARERYITILKTIPLNELLDELEHAAKKLGMHEPLSDHWEVAKYEVKLVRTAIVQRFGDK